MAAKVKLAIQTQEPETDDEPQEEVWEDATSGKAEKVAWLWPNRYMFKSVGILEGSKGVGKSSLAAALVAAATAGKKLPGMKGRERHSVLYLAGEDDWASVVRPRLESAGADLSRIKRLRGDPRGGPGRLYLPQGLETLEEGIQRFGARLVVLDPWVYYLDPLISSRSEQEVRSVLDELNAIAQRTRSCVLLLRNLTKNTNAERIHRGLGSTVIGDVARSIFAIDYPDRGKPRRIMRLVAGNAAGLVGALEYDLLFQEGQLRLDNFRELDAEDDEESAQGQDEGERDALGDAKRLLRLLLESQWVHSKLVLSEALSAGISIRTMRTAKAKLGVQSRRKKRANPPCWEWGPPKGGW